MKLYTEINRKKIQQITKQSKSNTLISLTKIVIEISNNWFDIFFFSQLEIALPFPSAESNLNIEKNKLLMV